ncbi:competence type IV pilus assembly protein ComGB [Bacillus sp. OV322]|uniref:competence type IV pilus assembly protein ComGB n=1 Tax=Bacillus sp. OV322 TaxID=1882764 RepID=UPI000B804435|nr:competence type IV pilus assembly protein ComGB [Bacillus sp. OV322]
MKMKRSKWNMKEQALLLSRLGDLLENGYPLSQALHFLKLQETKKKTADLENALLSLRDGNPLHSVLSELRFHPQLISYIFYAEHYGQLAKALKDAGSYWQKRAQDMEKIKNLLFYPIFLLVFAGNVFYVLQKVLIPKFQVLFQSMDAKENVFMNLVLSFTKILKEVPWILGILLFCILLLRQFWFRKLCPLKQRSLLLRIPIAGSFIRLFETHFFASQFSGLLSGGLSINESITLFSRNQQQPFYNKLCTRIREELTEGKSLEKIIGEMPYFEKHLGIITANGQKHGRLDQELFHYSSYLLKKIEERMAMIVRIIQPLLFSIIGLLVVSIYLAVLMPMFSLLDGI